MKYNCFVLVNITTPKFYILLFDLVIPDIEEYFGHPCVRFRNGNFEIVPCQLRFGRLSVPRATRNGMARSRVTTNMDGTGDGITADGTLGIRITKKEALDDLRISILAALEIINSLDMLRAQPSLKDDSHQSFITRKYMIRARKADPEMTGGNHHMVAGSGPSPSITGFLIRVWDEIEPKFLT